MKIRREAAARARRASWSATSAACRSAASASSRARSSAAGREIVGERYAKVSSPESIRFPPGKKAGGVLTLLVEGAHAPLIQHLAPMIIERVNRFFGYAAINRIVFRQGKPPAPRREARAAGASPGARRNLAKGCARSPIPSFAPAWSRLPRKLPLAAARRRSPRGDEPIPVINRSN